MTDRSLLPDTTAPTCGEPSGRTNAGRLSASRHLSLFTMATTMWTAYFLAGLPSNYFLTWSVTAQLVLLVILPTIVLVLIMRARVHGMSSMQAFRVACATAFYFTGPFFAYDWACLGVRAGLGWSFVESHWYLTAFYFTPWLKLPLLAVRASLQNNGGGIYAQ